ncbi:MAG: flagellin lysine-N-methylase [Alphaproteobacteria bacterium]
MHVYSFVDKFKCLADKCPTICCSGWSVQVDKKTQKLYREKAPELLDDIVVTDYGNEMKKNPITGFCNKLKNGLCQIHSDYGEEFLGDACYSYPRVTKKIGDSMLMTASLSCPEIIRLIFFESNSFTIANKDNLRIVNGLKDNLPRNITVEGFWKIHTNILNIAESKEYSSHQILSQLMSISISLDNIPTAEWSNAIEFLTSTVNARLSKNTEDNNSLYNLMILMAVLIKSSNLHQTLELKKLISNIETKLSIKINYDDASIILDEQVSSSKPKVNVNQSIQIENILKKYIQANLRINIFPFSSENSNFEKISVLIIKTIFLELALLSNMATNEELLDEQKVINIIQIFSKFFDHLADFNLFFLICADYGWNKESKLTSLINGFYSYFNYFSYEENFVHQNEA